MKQLIQSYKTGELGLFDVPHRPAIKTESWLPQLPRLCLPELRR